jgi:hypothetical protein
MLYPVWAPRRLSISSFGVLSGVDLAVFAVAWLMYVVFERNTGRVRELIDKVAGKSNVDAKISTSTDAVREFS